MDKEKVREIYSELQGYLSQFPIGDSPDRSIDDDDYSKNINSLVLELNRLTEEDFSRFNIGVHSIKYAGRTEVIHEIKISEYRTKVMGLIKILHSKFFQSEHEPFSSSPSTVNINSQHQEQSQVQNIKLLIDVSKVITKNLNNAETTAEEKTFLYEVEKVLPTINGGLDLLQKVSSIATKAGIAIAAVSKLFN
jgi:hypothetical protein